MATFRNPDRTYKEFCELICPTLRKIFDECEIYSALNYKKKLIVTSIYRSEQEQKALCKEIGKSYYATVHSDYRGLDFVIEKGTQKIYMELIDYININHPYGKGNLKTALYHEGTAWHVHLQVKSGTI